MCPYHNTGCIRSISHQIGHGIPCDSNSFSNASNSTAAVLTLHKGIAKNWLIVWCAVSLQKRTMMAKYFLSRWSLPPSQRIVYGKDRHCSITCEFKVGGESMLYNSCVFVLPEQYLLAILLSGNITLHSLEK